MRVRWARRGHELRVSASVWLAAVAMSSGLALTGCGHAPAKASPPAARQCGTGRTAANVPIAIEIDHGSISCATAMGVEKDYAQAIDQGKAPGNGGGGPVPVNGWICEGFPTPQVLKTGDASKCTKDGTEILALLTTPA
jgi:hypothetical protein